MVNTVRGVLVGLILVLGVTGQFDEEEKDYRGQFIGSLNSYHHQVSYPMVTTQTSHQGGETVLTFHLLVTSAWWSELHQEGESIGIYGICIVVFSS